MPISGEYLRKVSTTLDFLEFEANLTKDLSGDEC